jgi:phage-related protein
VTGRWVDGLTDGRIESALGTVQAAVQGIGRFLDGIRATLGPELVPAAADLASTLDHVAGPLGSTIGALLAGFVQLARGALPGLETAIGKLAPALQDIIDSGALQAIGEAFGASFGLAATVIGGVVGWLNRAGLLKPVILGLVGAFVAWRIAVVALSIALRLSPIGLIVTGVLALGAALVAAYNKVGWFRNAVDATFAWLKANWPLVLSILTGPIGAAVIYIIRHWDQIKAGASSVVGWVREKFNGLVSFFGSLPGRVGGAFAGLFDGIKHAFRSAINWVIGKWNGLEFSVPKVDLGPLGSIGGGKIGVPDIPMLATGGVVRGQGAPWVTGEAGPEVNQIMPGGRVRVTPLGSSGVATAGGGASLAGALAGGLPDLVVHTHVHQDGRETARSVDRYRLRELARKGS